MAKQEEKKAQDVQTEESSVDQLLSMLDTEQQGALGEFIKRIGKEHEVYRLTGAVIDSYIAEIDQVISDQMDEILHHEEFQELESTWRGLHFLVQNTEFTKPVKIEVLDAGKEEVFEDLEEAAAGEGYEKDSALWHHVYWRAYDKVGGHPYTAMISDYRFQNTNQDIKMLRHLSVLGEVAQLPFIGNADPEFFGEKDFEKVMNNRFLEEIVKEDARYTAWRSFREDDRAKYIGLTLPRFLGRLTYGPETEPTKNFNYVENVYRDGKDHSLWVNTSFALASNMVRSFEKWGWSVKLVGVDSGGRVENLPTPTYEEHGQTKIKVPVEASVGQAKDQELCEMGFIPLAHWDRTDYACFFELPSVQRPKIIKNNPEATANYSVGARLQYTFLVTRIAHYLKYRQLRFVGRNAGAGDIKKDLSTWLDTLVSDFPNPAESVIAERPLRSYSLEVHELEDRPGFFQIVAEFRPHVAIVGMDIKLRLVAYHSAGEE
ncbi:MAG: type VI secretion system contractile sheath large subunit [Calditrichaeota bacterium]|nr:MAG: type VI secretion system contractile sheath large subunit [Calditrichota bacterium]